MTRLVYGGTVADFGVTIAGGLMVVPGTTSTGTVWSAQSGGTQVTDLEDMSNNPRTTVSLASGPWFQFQGADSAGAQAAFWNVPLWIDFGTGLRLKIQPQQIAQSSEFLASFAPIQNSGPTWSGKAAGLLYNGTDETSTLNTIIAAAASFGVGTLALEGMSRADGQLIPPTTVVGGQARQAPLRITTANAQYAPGSTWTGADPYPGAGLDLRYKGRTDSGVTTTLNSAIVGNTAAVAADRGLLVTGPGIPDNTWVLAVNVGVGWTLSKAARATGTVSTVCMGGRIQSLGYGTLQIDRLTLLSGAATTAPFGISTGTRVLLDDNVFVGTTSKSGNTCDEDPWVFGGTGQGTALSSGLTSGNAYTSLSVQALPVGLLIGKQLTIGAGTSTQTVTLSANANTGDTTISVTSFTANANYPAWTGIAIASSANQALATSWSVPAAYHQGFASRMIGNQFYSCRRIGIGGYVTDLVLDRNAWMHNCGSNVAVAPSTLTSALTAGNTYTTLAVTALSAAVVAGDVIQVGVGDASTEFVASAGASAGATSVSVTSKTAPYNASIGTVTFNSTAGIGAPIYSYGDFIEANTVHIGYNRIGVSGGYTHMTRFEGASINSVIIGNDLQDMQADPNFIAGHRFGRGSVNNTVITGLQGTGEVIIDDWSASTGITSQTVIDPTHGSRFPAGAKVDSSLTFGFHSGGGFNCFDLDGDLLFTLSGAQRQWNFKGPLLMDGNSGGNGSTFLTIGNNSTASDAQITLNPPTGQAATVQFKYAGTNRWQIYNGAGASSLFVRDMTNSLMALTFTAGSGVTGSAAFAGQVAAAGTFQPNAARTTITGTTAGTAEWTQPFTGSSYKRVTVYLNGYQNASGTSQSFNYPTAFVNPPYVITDASGGATITASQIVLPASMGSTKTGWIIVEGY